MMTRDEAIEVAAAWWYGMIRNGVWDNGDAKTEMMKSMFKSMVPQPSEDDWKKVKDGLPGMIRAALDEHESKGWRPEIYADYGCRYIDDMYKSLGLNMSSAFFCPQKAGTQFKREGDDYKVLAKAGYRCDWIELEKLP